MKLKNATKDKTVKQLNNGKSKKTRTRSIRTTLIGAFCIPIILIIGLGIIAYQTAASGLESSYENSTISTMTSMANYMEFGFDMITSKARLLNSTSSLTEYYSGLYKIDEVAELAKLDEVKGVVNTNIMSEDYISSIYIFASYGRGISSEKSLPDGFYNTYIKSDDIAELIESGYTDTWIGLHPDLDTTVAKTTGDFSSKYALSYIREMTNSSNRPIGYIIIDVPTKFVTEALDESGLPEGSLMAYVTSDGRTLIRGEVVEDYVLTNQEYYRTAIADKSVKSGSQYISIGEESYLFIYEKEDVAGGILCAMIPESIITAQADDLKVITEIAVAVAAVIAIFLGLMISGTITKVLKKMVKVLSKTASGDLTGKVVIKRKDEFAILAENINSMIDHVKNLIYETNKTCNDVTESSGIVSSNSSVLVSSTEHIVGAIEDIEAGVEQQAEDTEACLNKIVDLSEHINGIFEGVSSMSEKANESKQKAGEGAEIVNELNERVRTSTQITREIVKDIEQLNEDTIEIGKFINAINDISDETNLLSLNAAIEAASAGSEGRGFAVVADQIGKLAHHSAEASSEIETIIKNLRERMKSTSQSAIKAQEIVESQEVVLLNTVELFIKIKESIESLSDKMEDILAGAKDMSESQHVTLGAIESITATSQETAAAASQLSSAADSQNQLITSLQSAVDKLNEEASNLNEAISAFKVE